MNRFSTLPAILLLSTLVGCASMNGPRSQTISVQTVHNHKEVADAGCILANGAGRWFVTTPGQVVIQKNIDDLTVDCSKEGVGAGTEVIASKANAGMWGNALLGGAVGYVVDRKSGAGYDYPQTVIVILKKPEEPRNQPGQNTPDVPAATTPPAAPTVAPTPAEGSVRQQFEEPSAAPLPPQKDT